MAVSDVTTYLAALDHPRADDIRRVRAEILQAEPLLTESIKWNAPNFLFGGEDRVTFRVAPGDVFQIILHRGAKVTGETMRVDAPAGLVKWASGDRGILTVPADVDGFLAEALPVITAWARA